MNTQDMLRQLENKKLRDFQDEVWDQVQRNWDFILYEIRGYIIRCGRIETVDEWPETEDRINAVTVQFVAGYSPVPKNIKQAVLLLIAHWFENREPLGSGETSNEIKFAVTALLDPDRNVMV